MNPVPAAVNAPRTPSVNLLPPEIGERRARQRARFVILLGMGVFILLLIGAWFFAYSNKQAAEADLALEQDLTTQKQQELASYNYLPALEAQLANSVNARAWVGATDIEWSTQLEAFFSAVPKNLRLTNVVVTAASPTAPVMSDGTPLAVLDYGDLSFAGTSAVPVTVSDFQDALDALPGFSNSFIQVISAEANDDSDTAYWTYSGTVRITANALSGRTSTSQEIVPLDENGQPAAIESEG